ncbi:hypothetical protein [Ornithinibacillus scapharcae]|uniref:hypothetical protein n=1 Tax=Ornithinibacillus scapharcae TaxID=1147159 RepID=UPI000225B6B1|nr:hypothetical protein [Ornithinibacillus scapharcae]
MFWKYTLFEMKLMLRNRKNWFLAVFMLLFFPLFFTYYSQTEIVPLKQKVQEESNMTYSLLDIYPDMYRETEAGKEVYENLLEQQSLVNYQVFYLGVGKDHDAFVEAGLRVNELRLRVHELDNLGIPEQFIFPKEEVLRNDAMLRYIQKHDLELETEPIVASSYILYALSTVSGLFFLIIILIGGSELLAYETKHRTAVNGFPIAFMKRILSKIGIHLVFFSTVLVLGIFAGITYVSSKVGSGSFSSPVLLYKDGDYVPISTSKFILFIVVGFIIVALMLLVLSVLLNQLLQNGYANVLIGIGIFLIPQLLQMIGITEFLSPLTYIDIVGVLSGDLASELGNPRIDFFNASTWLIMMIIALILLVYVKSKLPYIQQGFSKTKLSK